MIPLSLIACITLTPFLVINQPGTYVLCPGSYHSQISILHDNVTISCLGTRIIGPGLYEDGMWSESIQIVNGAILHENITIQGCTFENSTVAIGGLEVDEEGMHTVVSHIGRLFLKDNSFKTNYSLFWCVNSPGEVILERNRGSLGVILGDGTLSRRKDLLKILGSDPTRLPQEDCENRPTTTKAYK